MQILSIMKYPILFADIQNSRLRNGKKLMGEFKEIVRTVNSNKKKQLLSPLTITLGDEFQGVIDTIEDGIEIIFNLEELILQLDYDLKLRYVLHYGTIDTKINKQMAFEMLGEGLTEGRNQLMELKKESKRFFIHLDEKNLPKQEYINKAFSLYQSIVDSWKSKDRITVSAFLKHDDYKKVAEEINLNRSSAWRRKKSLNIEQYTDSKNLILYVLNT